MHLARNKHLMRAVWIILAGIAIAFFVTAQT